MPFKSRSKRKKYNREYRKRNADRLRPLDAAYRKKNRKRIIAYLRVWKKDNPDYDRKWRTKNKKKKCANQRKYRQLHPEKIRVFNAVYATKRTHAGGHFTEFQWLALCTRYDNLCLRCGKRRKLTPDHVVPVSKGGTSNIENIQPLCQPCNSSKNNKSTDYRIGAACRKQSQKPSGPAKP